MLNQYSIIIIARMLHLFFIVTLVSLVHGRRCAVDHYWRPFNGTIPSDAVIGGFDGNHSPSYIAKIVPLDSLWTTPAQMYQGEDHIDFAWFTEGDDFPDTMRIDQFIEILCQDEVNTLQWLHFRKNLDEVTSKCCLVTAGIGKFYGIGNEHTYVSHVGRVVINAVTYLGRLYRKEDDWPGVHVMVGAKSKKYFEDIEVLAYDCIKDCPIK